jgi:hypothetical protein
MTRKAWGGLGIACVLLAGCAHREPTVVFRDVKVPISIPCKVTEPAVPAYAADAVDLEATLFSLVRALLVEREQRKAETTELRAAVKACQT